MAILPHGNFHSKITFVTYSAFRYALENVANNEVLAEGVHADNTEALEQFRQSLQRSPLSPQEIEALEKAVAQYERAAG